MAPAPFPNDKILGNPPGSPPPPEAAFHDTTRPRRDPRSAGGDL